MAKFTGLMLIEKCKEVVADWHELFTPPLKAAEPIELLSDLIQTAEILVDGEGMGQIKRQIVLEAWDILDEQLKVSDKLAAKIPLFWPLSMFKKKVVHAVLDVVIAGIVLAFNAFVWNKIFGFFQKQVPSIPS